MNCQFPACKYEATHQNFCYQHFRVYGGKVEKPKPAPIAKKSDKARVEDKELSKLVKLLLAKPENKYCAIQLLGCTKLATTMNHKKRRFKGTKLNPEYLEPSCYHCNIEIENKDKEAREKGHLQSKYKIQ